ncbi:unnamed protein product [Zymoseptoria tritici ST99CH_1A5]|uniref:Uncharacterized protein n=3 Tax=Zymoseptoria tritici TaxID=1047171 RepID=F9XNV6_ZYMTI|nr:uncharacterized protein MYCGRDRAFT_111502 [Zymoseptoria tritici IPO323]EGP82939.1 hypothetical protein MYCGRDRAFT_111502 [Zymoseptoria tritici IPO323]SMR60980.1 unnamed protein product [Zymoseptoria tritici ST99CH_1E4]SMR64126.1 unnamed protein product [Zymoseptoria tritici ST99CH_3D1]SMY29472.1 unnamed protein product [Zymoseptoria tritici ST99CH_1A5]
MDCFQDFCLFCDRDSPDGPYCSQRCKLADLEKASSSNPGSPTSSRHDHRDTRYVLSPAYKFHSEQQQQQHQRTPGYDAPAANNSRRPRSSYFMWTASPTTQDRSLIEDRSLSPSSSRTSLSSTSSGSSTTDAFSAQAKQQLQEYFSSFDQARAAKRRSSTRST